MVWFVKGMGNSLKKVRKLMGKVRMKPDGFPIPLDMMRSLGMSDDELAKLLDMSVSYVQGIKLGLLPMLKKKYDILYHTFLNSRE